MTRPVSRFSRRPAVSKTVRRAAGVVVEGFEARTLFAAPAVDAIAAAAVPVGKTIQIPVTSTSTGGAVTYSVRVGNKSVIASFHPSKNTFIEMKVAGYSQPMVFQLFNESTPDTVRRIVGLVNSGFYDGLTFHRIVNNFVIQGGDPKGDGSGGPQFTFDDEFDPNTIFSGTGQLAMANSGKDTNGSQFFITEGQQRALDFNHTIFGQLVRGEATRAAISDTAVDANGKPNSTVTITSVNVISDNTDGVLVIKPTVAGSYAIKVTGTNADGSTSRSFTVTSAADTTNDPPILNTAAIQKVYYTQPGKPVTIGLTSTDIEGNSANFFAGQFVQSSGATGTFSGTNQNTLTVTPTTTAGAITLKVGVVGSQTDTTRGSTSADTTNGFNIFDSQSVTIAVGDLPISASATAFDATGGVSTGQILVGQIRDTDAAGLAANFTTQIDWGDGIVTAGTVKKLSSGRFGIYGTHTFSASASGAVPITLNVAGNLGALATATSVATVRTLADLVNGTLTINGTSADDKISLSRKGRNYTLTVNRVSRAFATGDVSLIQVFGLAGSDVISLSPLVYANTYLDGGDGNDAITGGVGNDIINAGAGADIVATGDGSNRVAGGAGNDTITGGTGRDRLFGGTENDSIIGGAGRDIVSGDEGNDILVGGASNDTLYGGAGNDILNGLSGADLVDGGAGTDTYKYDVLDTLVSVETRV